MKIGDVINQRYVIQEHLGTGSSAEVYLVSDSMAENESVIKVMKDIQGDVLHEIRNELTISKKLDHPNIIKTIDIDQIKSVSSGDMTYQDERYFLKMEYIPSKSLDKMIEENQIGLKQAKEYAKKLVEILVYLESTGVLHRDIASKNILISDRGPILIDFNVSKVIDSKTGTAGIGTIPYIPPEAILYGWKMGGDRYSVGVVIYEMVTGTLPFKSPTELVSKRDPIDPLELRPGLSEGLKEFLLKNISFEEKDRFQTSEEMLKVLDAIIWEQKKQPIGVHLNLTPLKYQFDDPTHNPILDDLLSLYSQSDRTNVGTRGLNPFSAVTYVKTLMDKRLSQLILSKRYYLIIITGNAGDGKTAFIQNFEKDVEKEKEKSVLIEQKTEKNGKIIIHDGWRFHTNYDGSQDEGDKENDDVLLEFLVAFKGKSMSSIEKETYIIAINEGRLKDFLFDHKDDFSYLYDQVIGALDMDLKIDNRFLLVNLNKRQLVFGDEENGSIFDEIIRTMISNDIWKHCEGCDIAKQCYVKFNMDSLNDPHFGGQIIQRLEALFQICHLRRKLHITIRDLRSALSYILFGTNTCKEIHDLVREEVHDELISRFYFNSLFNCSEEKSLDRLITIISEVDPGKTPNPSIEAKIYEHPIKKNPLYPYFDYRSSFDLDILDVMVSRTKEFKIDEEIGAAEDVKGYLANNYIVHRSLKRKSFFESIDLDWKSMLPYARLETFRLILRSETLQSYSDLKRDLLRSISLTEDPEENELSKEFLILRNRKDDRSLNKSFKAINLSKFDLIKEGILDVKDRYIEQTPSYISLIYKGLVDTRLDINLDLFEVLYRVLDGYLPSVNELRGPFVNLMIFKNLIANQVNDKVILQDPNGSRYEVFKSHQNTLTLRAL